MDIAREALAAHSPKNKKQIGQIGKGDKIYIEDYAVTYLNQIARAQDTKTGIAGLFGTCREVDGNKEYFIYAAIYQDCEEILDGGISREAAQKIMRRRAEEFCEYFFLGWALILKENKGTLWESCYRSRLETLMGKPELLMTLQCKTCEEHFYLYPTEMPKETEGYFIFYEQNDGMQNFLIDWHGEIHKNKCDEEGDNVAESCRNYYKEKRAKQFRTRLAAIMLGAAVLLLIFAAGIGVQNLNNFRKLQEAGSVMNEVVSETEAMSDVVLSSETGVDQNVVSEEKILSEEPSTPSSENVNVEPTVVGIAEEKSEEVESGEMSEAQESAEILEQQETVEASETEEAVKLTEAEEDIEPVEVEGTTVIEEPEQADEEEIVSGEISSEEVISQEADLVEQQYITYEVVEGDTVYGICIKFYGNLSKASEICELNKIENIDNILYGEKILLPQ